MLSHRSFENPPVGPSHPQAVRCGLAKTEMQTAQTRLSSTGWQKGVHLPAEPIPFVPSQTSIPNRHPAAADAAARAAACCAIVSVPYPRDAETLGAHFGKTWHRFGKTRHKDTWPAGWLHTCIVLCRESYDRSTDASERIRHTVYDRGVCRPRGPRRDRQSIVTVSPPRPPVPQCVTATRPVNAAHLMNTGARLQARTSAQSVHHQHWRRYPSA